MATFPQPHLLFPESPAAFGSSPVHPACTSGIAVLLCMGVISSPAFQSTESKGNLAAKRTELRHTKHPRTRAREGAASIFQSW